MRVALTVAVLVVPAVVSDPVEYRALYCKRSGNRQRDPHTGLCLKGQMGEIAVEAHRYAQAGNVVEDNRDDHVVPAEAPAPGQRDRCHQCEHRNCDEDRNQDPLQRALRFVLKIIKWCPDAGGCRLRRASRSGRDGSGAGRGGVDGSGHVDPRLALSRQLRDNRSASPWAGAPAEYAYVTVTYVTVGCTTPGEFSSGIVMSNNGYW